MTLASNIMTTQVKTKTNEVGKYFIGRICGECGSREAWNLLYSLSLNRPTISTFVARVIKRIGSTQFKNDFNETATFDGK
jgi:hypothetical protein